MGWPMHDPEGWEEVLRNAMCSYLGLDHTDENYGLLEWIRWERMEAWDAIFNLIPPDYITDAESDYLTKGAP